MGKEQSLIICKDRFVEIVCGHEQNRFGRTAAHAANKGFAIAEVPCFEDIFVQGGSSVLRTKFSAKTPRHRKPPERKPF